MAAITCKTCLADNQDELEALGLRAMAGEISWRSAAKLAGYGHYMPLRNHMEQHYVQQRQPVVLDEMGRYIEEAVADLLGQFSVAPPEVKPLILAAIHNIRELRDTKPSQQHLIMALKTIQEMTGMKQEQRMMLLFAERMFNEIPSPEDLPQLVENTATAYDDDTEYASTRGGD